MDEQTLDGVIEIIAIQAPSIKTDAVRDILKQSGFNKEQLFAIAVLAKLIAGDTATELVATETKLSNL